MNPRAFAKTLDDLRGRGLRIALDDYGEGFANLHLVRELRPDFLRISGSFCRGVDQDATRQTIVRSTVQMADCMEIPPR